MNQVILVAHGKLALAMKESAEMIFGELVNFKAITFVEEEGIVNLTNKILEAVQSHDGDTLIFTDIFYGTPYNASCAIALEHKEGHMEVISGMSLPLVLELAAMLQTKSVKQLTESLQLLSKKVVRRFILENIQEEEL